MEAKRLAAMRTQAGPLLQQAPQHGPLEVNTLQTRQGAQCLERRHAIDRRQLWPLRRGQP